METLAHACSWAQATDKECSTLLIAAMSTTPGFPKPLDLLGVTEEKISPRYS